MRYRPKGANIPPSERINFPKHKLKKILSSRIDSVSEARKQGLMEKRREKYKQYENIAYEKKR
jgi:hypothetical protein